jgi:glutamate synthase domain-containing protein 3
MSGEVRVKGNASAAAGATGQGGLIVIEGDAGTRCGISMKGVDIVVGGSVGAMSAFMAQAGSLVVCGNAGANLGDSLYEARIYVQGKVESLGADCVEKKMTPHHVAKLEKLLKRAGIRADPNKFKRYGSARKLYNFHVDNVDAY